MGATKKWAIEIAANMSQETFDQIPEHLRNEMTLKKVDYPEFKEVYRKDEEWQKLNDEFIEKLKARQAREEQIRVNERNK